MIEPGISFTTEDNGATRVDLTLEGRRVSRCWIIPYTLRIGAASVRMDGIGGVGTEEEYRHRGYARRVLDAAIDRMTSGDAAISALFGITGLYQKFGYATAGPDSSLEIRGPFEDARLPAGWTARAVSPDDVRDLQAVYDRCTASSVGAALRPRNGYPWKTMIDGQADGSDDARVIVSPGGHVSGYVWQGRKIWEVGRSLIPNNPDALVLAEALAVDHDAAKALLALCRVCAVEECERRARPVERVVLSLPREGNVAAAAMRDTATFRQRFTRDGDFMVRVLDVQRLFGTIEPELSRHVRSARIPFTGTVCFETELGSASIAITAEGVTVLPEETAVNGSVKLRIPSPELGRLVFGAFPPEDLLALLPEAPGDAAARMVELLFPRRHPHLYLADHF